MSGKSTKVAVDGGIGNVWNTQDTNPSMKEDMSGGK
jgi:hypothetical protein